MKTMNRDKTDILLLFGGQSAEHPISIRSARAVISNLDRDRYRIELVYIHRNGHWSRLSGPDFTEAELETLPAQAPAPWGPHRSTPVFPFQDLSPDIVFPILHGPNGEDGRLQGYLQMLGIPFVGCTSVGSMLAMDKGLSKGMSQLAGIPVVGYQVFNRGEENMAAAVNRAFTYPVFVKPCNLGSSVGISRVDRPEALDSALSLALEHDERIIVEQGIPVREIELSVLGRYPDIRVSAPGELMPHNAFYDFNDKYVDGQTTFSLPAPLTPDQTQEAQNLAREAYRIHQLDGFARVDLFLHKETGRFYLNEINTIPGFTEISMFPKLWQLEGISFPVLLDTLIQLGFETTGS
jgi:D-alanine-D-alanine ligase